MKSTNCFQESFSRIASEILYVAIDGRYPNNPVTNDYKHLARPIWPCVEDPHNALG